ncbi:hypothetical protein EYC80_000738 [Monilinia laxa]|uniref:Uncharacterized protein n=1 Tax=Monilinia laxa TaxID=61186 RepID=A0A5N6K700_MONLA|nr:hypothetical protein EYC80_000738 [Monilinia laxa]
MKQLLPLKLSSPQTPDFDSRSASRSTKRTTFGQLGRLGGLSNPGDGAENKLESPPRISIRPARYRDTPIFSKSGSLLLGGPLYQDKCPKCFNESGCTTSCIIDEYESFSDSASSKGYSSDYSDRHIPSVASSPISSRRRYQTDSEFSFKCLGEPSLDSESSWFGRPNKQRVNSRSSVNIEEWLSDNSMCEGSDDDDSDDFFACATALAPAKAHVVQVNHKPSPRLSSPRLSITIPQQPKINTSLKHSDSSALRKLTSRSSINDLAMSSPPTSPEEPTSNNFSNNQQGLLSPIDLSPTPASPDTILDIVAAIEDCTSNFPTKMLLADTPCISSIRSHLKVTLRISAAQKSPQKLASTTLPRTFNKNRPKYLSRRHRAQNICLSPTSDSQSFISQIPATPPSTPPSSVDFSISSAPSTTTQTKSSILPTFASQLAAANLQPLHTIFPISSDFLRSALYGHILSYIFILSLPSTNTANSDTHSTLPTPFPPPHELPRNITPLSPQKTTLLSPILLLLPQHINRWNPRQSRFNSRTLLLDLLPSKLGSRNPD